MTAPLPLEGEARADAADSALRLPSAQPGQNIFAQREVARHRHLLQSNSAYQRAYLEKLNLPPDIIHPAFRQPGLSLDTSLPIPTMPMPDSIRAEQRRHHGSMTTTMSPFVNAGQQTLPEINLATTPELPADPTVRGIIEERAEQFQHNVSGSDKNRIPVYCPSPKTSSEGLKRPPKTTEKVKAEVKFGVDTVYQFTPKKKARFFERLLGGGKRGIENVSSTEPVQRMPVKAEAVLGSKQPALPLRRSTSKKTSFFSRRSSDAASNGATSMNESQRPSTSMGFAGSTSRRSSRSSKRVNSRAGSETAKANKILGVTRTQSLKYFDAAAPPTPPLKDTPPDVKIIRHVNMHNEAIVPFSNQTPTQSAGFLSANAHLTPTNTGNYATRSGARIVTQPSTHSLHASVHMGSLSQEVRDGLKHMDALGIAGYNDEKPPPQIAYSPSTYSQVNSPDLRNSVAHLPKTIHEEEEVQPVAAVKHQEPLRSSFNTEGTNCTSGTIHVCRDFERENSIVDFMRRDPNAIFSSSTTTRPTKQSKLFNQLDNMLATPSASKKSCSACNGQNVSSPHKMTASPASPMSPMSPMSHNSAQVSPLHSRRAAPPSVPRTPHSKSNRRNAIGPNDADDLVTARHQEFEDSPTVKGDAIFANRPILMPTVYVPKERISSQPRKSETEEPVQLKSDAAHDSGVETHERMNDKHKRVSRVSTTFAHDFYRSPQTHSAQTPATEAPNSTQTPNMLNEGVSQTAIIAGSFNATDSGALDKHRSVCVESSVSNIRGGAPSMDQQFLMSLFHQQSQELSQISERIARMEAEMTRERDSNGARKIKQQQSQMEERIVRMEAEMTRERDSNNARKIKQQQSQMEERIARMESEMIRGRDSNNSRKIKQQQSQMDERIARMEAEMTRKHVAKSPRKVKQQQEETEDEYWFNPG